jgi:hypothetical protein
MVHKGSKRPMNDDGPDYPVECTYCGATDCTDSVPDVTDDAAWAALASEHNYNCEWIITRAHRKEQTK